MRFSKVDAVRIPNGTATRIRHNGKVLWKPIGARYVSLGDSIAAGHAIDGDWEKNYGYGSQYGENGNVETVVVPNTYTDLIHRELIVRTGGKVNTTSFARSGDTVADLMAKLDHAVVRDAIAKADYVTVCIGANEVLQPALMNIDQYINTGDLSGITAIVDANLAKLADDSNANSYKALFDKLSAINPNANYVFTTVYNPYKYLWLETSTAANDYKDGFLGPLMWCVPDVLGSTIANSIRSAFLSADYVQLVFNRINGVGEWAENQVTKLNNVLRSKISAYGNANILLADTKAVFDPVPDRPISAPKHYNDLVNVEPTRGYVIEDLDWSQFWGNINWGEALSNMSDIANQVMETVLNYVILPDIDPHPEWYGHYAMKCSFIDALGWSALPRRTITFNANGGTGTMAQQTVVALDSMTAYTNINAVAFAGATDGHHFAGWNTAAGGGGSSYTNRQFIGLTGNMTLYAQWSNVCTVIVRHSIGDSLPSYGSGDTGPMECYALWIDGVEQSDLGAFSNGARVYNLPYGSQVGVIAQTQYGGSMSYISLNGATIAGKSDDARYTFTVTSNMDIHFEWNNWIDLSGMVSYWNCYVTTY